MEWEIAGSMSMIYAQSYATYCIVIRPHTAAPIYQSIQSIDCKILFSAKQSYRPHYRRVQTVHHYHTDQQDEMEREIQHTHHHNPHLIHLSISVHSVMQYETHVKWRFSIINSSRCYSNFRLHLYPHPHPLPHHPPYCSLPHPARLVFIESRILR